LKKIRIVEVFVSGPFSVAPAAGNYLEAGF
jgi:hypothetical protein